MGQRCRTRRPSPGSAQKTAQRLRNLDVGKPRHNPERQPCDGCERTDKKRRDHGGERQPGPPAGFIPPRPPFDAVRSQQCEDKRALLAGDRGWSKVRGDVPRPGCVPRPRAPRSGCSTPREPVSKPGGRFGLAGSPSLWLCLAKPPLPHPQHPQCFERCHPRGVPCSLLKTPLRGVRTAGLAPRAVQPAPTQARLG